MTTEERVTVSELLVEVRKLHDGHKFPFTSWELQWDEMEIPPLPPSASASASSFSSHHLQHTSYPPHASSSTTTHRSTLDELIYREEVSVDNFVGSPLADLPLPHQQHQQHQQHHQSASMWQHSYQQPQLFIGYQPLHAPPSMSLPKMDFLDNTRMQGKHGNNNNNNHIKNNYITHEDILLDPSTMLS